MVIFINQLSLRRCERISRSIDRVSNRNKHDQPRAKSAHSLLRTIINFVPLSLPPGTTVLFLLFSVEYKNQRVDVSEKSSLFKESYIRRG